MPNPMDLVKTVQAGVSAGTITQANVKQVLTDTAKADNLTLVVNGETLNQQSGFLGQVGKVAPVVAAIVGGTIASSAMTSVNQTQTNGGEPTPTALPADQVSEGGVAGGELQLSQPVPAVSTLSPLADTGTGQPASGSWNIWDAAKGAVVSATSDLGSIFKSATGSVTASPTNQTNPSSAPTATDQAYIAPTDPWYKNPRKVMLLLVVLLLLILFLR